MSNYEAEKPKFSVAISSATYQRLINNTLGDPEHAKRFVASITSAVAVNPDLQRCETASIVAGALLGESLGLSPSPQLGQYYLIPFDYQLKDENGNKLWAVDEAGNNLTDEKGRWIPIKSTKAQFILGYKGYLQLALSSNQFKRLIVSEVKEGELIDWNPFEEEFEAVHKPAEERETLETIGYYVMFETIGGLIKKIYRTKSEMLEHADKYSPAFSKWAYLDLQADRIPKNELWKYSSPWYKEFDLMAEKTILRRLLSTWVISSPGLKTALTYDSRAVEMDTKGNFTNAGSEADIVETTATDTAGNSPNQNTPKKVNLADV